MADPGEKIRFQRACPLGVLAGFLKLSLDLFPMREVAQEGAKARRPFLAGAGRCPDAAKRHEDRNSPALPGEADDLAPLIEQTGGALRFQPFEIGIRQRPAFRCDQAGEMLTRHLVLIVAEKSLAGAVQA